MRFNNEIQYIEATIEIGARAIEAREQLDHTISEFLWYSEDIAFSHSALAECGWMDQEAQTAQILEAKYAELQRELDFHRGWK